MTHEVNVYEDDTLVYSQKINKKKLVWCNLSIKVNTNPTQCN